jgi:hypothetical protein
VRRRPSPLVLLVAAWSALAVGQSDIDRSPFAAVAVDLIAHVHAQVVPCDVVLDRATLCFTLAPGTVATVAEQLEALVQASSGILTRSSWRSANGVHHVELLLHDELWGVLEVWLREPGDRSVVGMLKYLARRRMVQP